MPFITFEPCILNPGESPVQRFHRSPVKVKGQKWSWRCKTLHFQPSFLSSNENYPKMNTSTVLTGYNESSISLLDSTPSSQNVFYDLVETYANPRRDDKSMEGPSNLYGSGSTKMDTLAETLYGSCLFGRLPWTTPDLADHFKTPKGTSRVLAPLFLFIGLNT